MLAMAIVGCGKTLETSHSVSTRPYGPYQNLYAQGFRKLLRVESPSILSVGISQAYPISQSELWSACLDVIGQYDAVAYLSPSEKVAVFAHGLNVVSADSELTIRYYDTLIVVHIQSRGDKRSVVHAAWLDPRTLKPTKIEVMPQITDEAFRDAAPIRSRQLAASIVIKNFYAQLSTQSLYESRWKDKFDL